jgi:hypothetical protein
LNQEGDWVENISSIGVDTVSIFKHYLWSFNNYCVVYIITIVSEWLILGSISRAIGTLKYSDYAWQNVAKRTTPTSQDKW